MQPILAALTDPWNAFVIAFLYFALLAILALAGLSPELPVVVTAYAAPFVAYAVFVIARLVAQYPGGEPVSPQSLTNAAR